MARWDDCADRMRRDLNQRVDAEILRSFSLPPDVKWFSLNFKEEPVEKTATQKLDEVKSTVANLEMDLKGARAQRALTEEVNKRLEREIEKLRSPMQRDDRALYINKDGTLKNGQVWLEQRADRLWQTGPAYEIRTVETKPEPISVRWAEYMEPVPVPVTHRRFRHAFSQGSLHVYQEV